MTHTASKSGQKLRTQAEKKIRGEESSDRETMPADTEQRLLHELQVHHIELEMQNKELRRSQQELEASRARYFDLYNLAPVGYLTLNEQGVQSHQRQSVWRSRRYAYQSTALPLYLPR